MQYRRDYTKGATYFFTVVAFLRKPIFDTPARIAQLREAFRAEMARRPFHIDAIVVLPDHIHAVWTLPPEDADYSIRWRNIKRAFTLHIETEHRPAVSARRLRKKEQAIWQSRFWEHRIRDARDYAHHVDYVHHNPVKHGYVQRAVDWPYSSIHKYVRQGILPTHWGCGPLAFPDNVGHE